jgi:hypothetical protein
MTDTTDKHAVKSDADSQDKLTKKIKETWSKLNDEDVKLYATNRMQFFNRLKEKQNVSKEDAEKHLAKMEADCGCGSSKAA